MSEEAVEVLVDGDVSASTVNARNEVEVYEGTNTLELVVTDVEMTEVFEVTPNPDALIESLDFTHAGPLAVKVGPTQRPVVGGSFSFVSIGARASTAPVGSSVVLDVKKNGASIFALPADRPTIAAGSNDAIVGSWGNVTVTTGDYISVDIVAVGSTEPGSDLVLNLRMRKIS